MAGVAQEAPAVDNIELVSLQISLPDMLNLAIGSPEPGAVNFHILHNFLHVLLHLINLQTTKVEYRGENAERVKTIAASLKSEPSLHLQEYSVTDATGKVSQRVSEAVGIDVHVLAEEEDLKVTKGISQQWAPEKSAEAEKILFVEPIVAGSTPSALAFKQLELSVKQLQQQFQALQELSTNAEVMERLKRRITDPVNDLWQFININKRLEASEQGIDKLTSILQDIIKSDAVATISDTQPFSERLNELENKVSKMMQEFAGLQAVADILKESGLILADDSMDAELETDEAARKKEEMTKKLSKAMVNMLSAQQITADAAGVAEMLDNFSVMKENTAQMQQELEDLKKRVAQTMKDEYKLYDVSEGDVQKICDEALLNLTRRVDALEKNVNDLFDRMNSLPADDIGKLVTKIQDIQKDLEKFSQTADMLLDDKESQEAHLCTLLEQIEILKTVKADKEDLEDALADKADAQIMNRKVSHERFDTTCDYFTRGLEEAIDKLSKQELIWQQALDEVQNEIASKVDKIEMTPLKDFVNDRLQLLQEKLKSLSEMKHEREAAGTKKLLRDIQCISCDKDVVMRTEEPGMIRFDPLPCTSSIKPYLTYELDQVRKQQRKLPPGRDMIQFETAVKETKKMKTTKEKTPPKTPRDHLCNRYCGGSHTTTTPQNRVLRLKHFLSQWGPEAIQLSDGMIKGKDGQMYRGSPVKLDVCGSAYFENQISDEVQPQVAVDEHKPSSLPSSRTTITTRRNSVTSQKRLSNSVSKELRPSQELIEEAPQVTPPKEIKDYSLITEAQDEIIYEPPNEMPEEEQIE